MTDDTHEGWTNRETWALALHIDCDRDWLDSWIAYAGSGEPVEVALEEWLDAHRDDVVSQKASEDVRRMVNDIGSPWRVNFREVAEHYVTKAREAA